MISMKHIIFLFICSFVMLANITSQCDSSIQIIYKIDDNKAILRWAPTNAETWMRLVRMGAEVLFVKLEQNDSIDIEKFDLSRKVIRPWGLSRFEAEYNMDTIDRYTKIIGGLLYGDFESRDTTSSIYAQLMQSQEIRNRYSAYLLASDLSRTASISAGLRYEQNIDTSSSYFFRFVLKSLQDNLPSDTCFLYVDKEGSYYQQMPQLELGHEGEKTITLLWNREYHKNLFSAYHVQRSEDGGETFHRVTNNPYLSAEVESEFGQNFVYQDSLKENYKTYHYRLVGVTPFGEFSEPSNTVTGMGRDRTPPTPPGQLEVNVIDAGLYLSWSIDTVDADIYGFLIERSTVPDSGFAMLDTILPHDAREFVDRTFEDRYKYYRVVVFDTVGNYSISHFTYVFIVDTIPPLNPKWKSYEIDSLGNVQINWYQNDENDLKGYKVYYANDTDHVFTTLVGVPVIDTTFQFTVPLNNLTEHVYLKLTALDRSFNHSEFSEILEIEKPDTISPSSPVFTGYNILQNGVQLRWAQSSSHDVEYHKLYRRTNQDLTGNEIFVFSDTNTESFIDTTVMPNMYYGYILYAIDDDLNISQPSQELIIRAGGKHRRIDIPEWSVVEVSNGVEIHWDNSNYQNINCRIFRRIDSYPPKQITSTRSTEHFDDWSTITGETIEYRIQLLDPETGTTSAISDGLIISMSND